MDTLDRLARANLLDKWHWSPEQDLCIDSYKPDPEPRPWPKEIDKPHVELPEVYRDIAQDYIRVLTSVYPFQMRAYFGDPMWMRYCATWTESPGYWSLAERHRKAMSAI